MNDSLAVGIMKVSVRLRKLAAVTNWPCLRLEYQSVRLYRMINVYQSDAYLKPLRGWTGRVVEAKIIADSD